MNLLVNEMGLRSVQTRTRDFHMPGSSLTVRFSRDPDVERGMAGIESIEQVSRHAGQWTTEKRLNGDQSNQGRQLLLDPHQQHIFRVRLYSIPLAPRS